MSGSLLHTNLACTCKKCIPEIQAVKNCSLVGSALFRPETSRTERLRRRNLQLGTTPNSRQYAKRAKGGWVGKRKSLTRPLLSIKSIAQRLPFRLVQQSHNLMAGNSFVSAVRSEAQSHQDGTRTPVSNISTNHRVAVRRLHVTAKASVMMRCDPPLVIHSRHSLPIEMYITF